MCQAIRKISMQGETLCQPPRCTVLEISDKGIKMLDKSKTNVSRNYNIHKYIVVSLYFVCDNTVLANRDKAYFVCDNTVLANRDKALVN